MGWVFLRLVEDRMNPGESIRSDCIWRGAKQAVLSLAALALAAGMSLPARAGDIPRMKMHGMQANPAPTYPQTAKNMKLSGEVYLEVVVNPQGAIKEVRPTAGPSILSRAAMDAVRQWKFASGPYEHVVVVAFNFTNP
jgi:TonB family protein